MAKDIIVTKPILQYYDEKLKAWTQAKDADNLAAAQQYADDLADNYEAAGSVATAVQALKDGEIKELQDAVGTLNGDANTAGSVDKKIADTKKTIDEAVVAVDAKADKNAEDIAAINNASTGVLKQAKDYADGKDTAIQAAQSAADKAQGEVDALEERVEVTEREIGTIENLETTNKADLVVAINEVRNAVAVGGTQAAITMDTTTTTAGMLKSYTIKQGDNVIGTIDIPKELMAVSGAVVVNPDGMAAGTYIELTIQNGDPVYIDVASLIDNYTAKANAAQVQIAIDPSTREISASLVAGGVGTNEIADLAITTAKIADGNVTKAKLSTAVQSSLDKADAAEGNAKAYTDEKFGAADERLQDIEAMLSGEGTGTVAEQIAAAEKNAKDYADAEIAKVNENVTKNANDLSTLAGRVTVNEGNISTNAGNITALQGRMDTAEGKITTLEGKVSANESAIAGHNTRLGEVESKANANADAILALQELVGEGYEICQQSDIDAMFANA